MIITNNEELLRIRCEDVLLEEVGSLVDSLGNELKHANILGAGGIGLAAPQIGIAKNIAIIRTRDINIDLVNCKIDKKFDPAIFKNEGCLSFPGRVENTNRFQEIYVVNNLVYPHNFIATGLNAIVCQHELDHLNSVLFIDRAVKPQASKIRIKPNDLCICGSGKKYKRCSCH